MKSKSRYLAILFLLGAASVAFASWPNPVDGLIHDGDDTCDTSKCNRACRVCCSNYNPVGSAPWTTCNNKCVGLGEACPANGNPGGGGGEE